MDRRDKIGAGHRPRPSRCVEGDDPSPGIAKCRDILQQGRDPHIIGIKIAFDQPDHRQFKRAHHRRDIRRPLNPQPARP